MPSVGLDIFSTARSACPAPLSQIFAASIHTGRTCRAFVRATAEFLARRDDRGVSSTAAAHPLDVATGRVRYQVSYGGLARLIHARPKPVELAIFLKREIHRELLYQAKQPIHLGIPLLELTSLNGSERMLRRKDRITVV